MPFPVTVLQQHDDSEDEDHHNRSSQLGNAADGTEEQGLLPIKPGKRNTDRRCHHCICSLKLAACKSEH